MTFGSESKLIALESSLLMRKDLILECDRVDSPVHKIHRLLVKALGNVLIEHMVALDGQRAVHIDRESVVSGDKAPLP